MGIHFHTTSTIWLGVEGGGGGVSCKMCLPRKMHVVFLWTFEPLKTGVNGNNIGVHSRMLGSIQECWGPFKNIGVHSGNQEWGPFKNVGVHSRMLGSIQECWGPFKNVGVHSRMLGSIQECWGPFKNVGVHSRMLGSIQECWGPFKNVGVHSRMLGSIQI